MDIAYIYTWNRNEPMRFFYKINARMTVPVMPVPDKCFAEPPQTDVQSAAAESLCENSQTLAAADATPPQQVKFVTTAAGPNPTTAGTPASNAKRTAAVTVQPAADLLMKTQQQSSATAAENQPEKPSKTECVRLQDHHPTVQRIAVKKERQPVTVAPVPLNPPISPEGTSRKENVPDNVRNSCTKNGAGEPAAVTAAVAAEEKKPQQNVMEPPPAADVPMKRLEKLVDQQQQTAAPVAVNTGSSTAAAAAAITTVTVTSAVTSSTANVATPVNNASTAAAATGVPPRPLSKKPVAGESKLNLSISKLIMKNQNAAAAAAAGDGAGKFVPTLQQMQQIGMHTSIPNFQQQQQQQQPPPPPSPSPQPMNGAYARPGYHCIQPSFKRTGTDATPVRSQAPTNRPPFIPVRKSYEWNKARNLASKPAAFKDAAKPNNEKPTTKKKTATAMDSNSKSHTCVMSAKNSDEMNAAQSLLRVGHDLWLSSSTSTAKPQAPPAVPLMADLHDKYNCESSLQITKVTEPETNQPQEKLQPSSSQPSLQIMRVPPAADKSAAARPTIGATDTVSTSSAANSGNATIVTTTATTAVTNTAVTAGKPVNKKPVPSLYSMPTTTKRPKEQHNGVPAHMQDNKRIERRVDTENGVLSVSLLTETSKQDMDAKRREVVQPDVSIKLMTFASAEPVKKTTPESNAGGGALNNNKRKLQQDESTNAVVVNSKRKLQQQQDESGTNNSKRKQEEPERKVTPPRPAAMTNCKDDVPQLIEINSSPYAKLLPAKKQQPATTAAATATAAAAAAAKHQTTTKLQQLKYHQQPTKLQQQKLHQQPVTTAATNVLDLSKSPPNGAVVKQRFGGTCTDGGGRFSPVTGKMMTGGSGNNSSSSSPVQYDPSTMAAATSAAINSNLLFAAQRQAAAFLLKQHFDTLNNGLMRNGGGNGGGGGGGGVAGKGSAAAVEWPRAMFNPALFARPPPPTNLNN